MQDPGVEFCGPNVACLDSTTFNGVLLDPDSIDFKTSSVVFTLDFNALVDPQNLAGPFWFGVPGATFTLSNFAFDTAAQLVSISSTSSGNLTGATITPNLPLGTVSIDLSNASVATPGQVTITVSLGARETPQPPVPEPTTMLLLGTALVGVVARRRLTQ